MVEWQTEWKYGRNGGWNDGVVAEWSNGGKAGMVDGMAEWLPNGRMVDWQEWLPTYYFMVHTTVLLVLRQKHYRHKIFVV